MFMLFNKIIDHCFFFFFPLAAVYPVSVISKVTTENFLFSDPVIAGGPCPVCGVENRVFFGDVLGVEGDKDESTVKCTNCKNMMTIKRYYIVCMTGVI